MQPNTSPSKTLDTISVAEAGSLPELSTALLSIRKGKKDLNRREAVTLLICYFSYVFFRWFLFPLDTLSLG